MANLFQTNFSVSDLSRIFAESPRGHILPPMGSEAWDNVRRNPIVRQWMGPLCERAQAEAGDPLPELTNDLYREFYRSGVRLNFENVYFERRRQLARAAISALLEKEDPRWLESASRKTEDILGEFSWAIPAHANSLSGRDPAHIDLFAAETANLMGELVDLFGDSLGQDLITRIKWRLRTQFFENYINRHEDFFWTLSAGNWNAVCHQGVIGAALSIEDDADLLAKLLILAKKYLPIFLGGFGDDGGCSEGPGYWQYGFGWFCVLNEQLETRTNGEISLIEGDAKITQIAHYGPRTSLRNFYFVNFSDSSQSGYINPALLCYLGKRLRDDQLLLHAQMHYLHLQQNGINLNAHRCDLFFLARLFLHCPEELPQETSVEYEDVYFKNMAVVAAHGRDEKGNYWDFAAKAGHNNEQHNHNDCGSYILNINGVPMIIEIGAPEYTKDYFRERRYEFLAARSLGHSLPIVNGCEQAAGPHHVAKVLNVDLEPDHLDFCIDLTDCYPSSAGCGEVVRDFKWDKHSGRLQVKDYYELSKHESFESSIITDKEVKLTEEQAVLKSGKESLVIRPLLNTVFAGVEDHEYRDHIGIPRKVWRIILKPRQLDKQRFISYEIVLEQ
jgi:hypothetical protein